MITRGRAGALFLALVGLEVVNRHPRLLLRILLALLAAFGAFMLDWYFRGSP